MPLWKLEPIDPTDRNWEASTYIGEAIVRAEDSRRARLLAARAYGIATRRVLGEEVKVVPWDYPGLVRSAQVPATDEYAEDGAQGIVFPTAAVDAAGPGYQGNN